LNGFFHWKFNGINLFTDDKPKSAYDERSTTSVVPFHEENFLPQTEVGLNAQECFIEGDKDGKMKD
jgi:hypothetical protein